MSALEMDMNYIKSIASLHSSEFIATEEPSNIQSTLEDALQNKTGSNIDLSTSVSVLVKQRGDDMKNKSVPTEESKTTSSSDNELELDLLKEDLMCVICKEMDVGVGNRLLECSDCHSLYHQECHHPIVTTQEADNNWVCQNCKDIKRADKSTTVMSNSGSKSSTNQSCISDTHSYKSSVIKSGTKRPASPAKISASKTNNGPSTSGSTSRSNTTPNINIVSAEKKIQIMKKKAAAKQQEKRKLPRLLDTTTAPGKLKKTGGRKRKPKSVMEEESGSKDTSEIREESDEEPINLEDYKCVVCKTCIVGPNNRLFRCSNCEFLYHQRCQRPIISGRALPRTWICEYCKTRKNKKTGLITAATIKNNEARAKEIARLAILKSSENVKKTEMLGEAEATPASFKIDSMPMIADDIVTNDELALALKKLVCVVCRYYDMGDENRLLKCWRCKLFYHQNCHKPVILFEEIKYRWLCRKCKGMKIRKRPAKPTIRTAVSRPILKPKRSIRIKNAKARQLKREKYGMVSIKVSLPLDRIDMSAIAKIERNRAKNVTDAQLKLNLMQALVCIICRNIKTCIGNCLVSCWTCKKIFHQECHNPVVTSEDLLIHWSCKTCKDVQDAEQRARASVSSKEIVSMKVSLSLDRINMDAINAIIKRKASVSENQVQELSCFICRKIDTGVGNRLLDCWKCKKKYHQKCHVPIDTSEAIYMLWSCKDCKGVKEEEYEFRSSHRRKKKKASKKMRALSAAFKAKRTSEFLKRIVEDQQKYELVASTNVPAVKKVNIEAIKTVQKPKKVSDVRRKRKMEEVKCSLCRKSDTAISNLLIRCRECKGIYHQKCHVPKVSSLDVDIYWSCQKCRDVREVEDEKVAMRTAPLKSILKKSGDQQRLKHGIFTTSQPEADDEQRLVIDIQPLEEREEEPISVPTCIQKIPNFDDYCKMQEKLLKCSVCHGVNMEPTNPLLKCCRCHVLYHQNCMDIAQIDNTWICRKCNTCVPESKSPKKTNEKPSTSQSPGKKPQNRKSPIKASSTTTKQRRHSKNIVCHVEDKKIKTEVVLEKDLKCVICMRSNLMSKDRLMKCSKCKSFYHQNCRRLVFTNEKINPKLFCKYCKNKKVSRHDTSDIDRPQKSHLVKLYMDNRNLKYTPTPTTKREPTQPATSAQLIAAIKKRVDNINIESGNAEEISTPLVRRRTIRCNICKKSRGNATNRILRCADCKCHYHQHCEIPPITSDEISSDWNCRKCGENLAAAIFTDVPVSNTEQNPAEPTKVIIESVSNLKYEESKHFVCLVCKQMGAQAKNRLLECFKCHSLYHEKCQKQDFTNQGIIINWICSYCMDSRIPIDVPKNIHLKKVQNFRMLKTKSKSLLRSDLKQPTMQVEAKGIDKRSKPFSPTLGSIKEKPAQISTHKGTLPSTSSAAADYQFMPTKIEEGKITYNMCMVCKGSNMDKINRLIECAKCHNLYHQYCHRPAVTCLEIGIPWTCIYCKDEDGCPSPYGSSDLDSS